MTTTTTERDAALARLREVVKPGDRVTVVHRGRTRSYAPKIALYAPDEGYDLTPDAAVVLGFRHNSLDEAMIAYARGGSRYGVPAAVVISDLADQLFGDPMALTWRSL